MSRFCVARQAIYDRDLCVVAYELLFRGEPGAVVARIEDPHEATSRVLIDTFYTLGFDNALSGQVAYINLPRSAAVGDWTPPLPPDRVVLEIVEDLVVDAALLRGLGRLRKLGYTLALDDFEWGGPQQELVGLVDIVKLDAIALGIDGLTDHVRHLAAYPVRLLAEKVETREVLDHALELGIELFQGYFLEVPATMGVDVDIPAPRTRRESQPELLALDARMTKLAAS